MIKNAPQFNPCGAFFIYNTIYYSTEFSHFYTTALSRSCIFRFFMLYFTLTEYRKYGTKGLLPGR